MSSQLKNNETRQKILNLFDKWKKNLDNYSFFQKAFTCIYLFDFLDRLNKLNFPPNWFAMLEVEGDQLIQTYQLQYQIFDFSLNAFQHHGDGQNTAIEEQTGEVYFNLWKDFSKQEYYAQTKAYLQERFEKNGIQLNRIQTALDDGCGGGRYTFALKDLGCDKITGVDISENSVNFARKMNPFREVEVSFLQTSVLDLPFENESFDFVFSNGVLHHTRDTFKGIAEIFRILKKGGNCWLYLYGGKDSFFWDMVDFCRNLLQSIPQNYMQTLMKTMGYPAGRIFHRCDFFYVPIHNRYYSSEVEQMLRELGFTDFKRLNRGIAYDWDEMIFHNPQMDPYIYGEGEMRYWITKS